MKDQELTVGIKHLYFPLKDLNARSCLTFLYINCIYLHAGFYIEVLFGIHNCYYTNFI